MTPKKILSCGLALLLSALSPGWQGTEALAASFRAGGKINPNRGGARASSPASSQLPKPPGRISFHGELKTAAQIQAAPPIQEAPAASHPSRAKEAFAARRTTELQGGIAEPLPAAPGKGADLPSQAERTARELLQTLDAAHVDPGKADSDLRAFYDAQKKSGQSPVPAQGSEPAAHCGLWRSMEKGLSKVLGARNLPSRAEAWRGQSADILRNEPSLPVEAALLKAFARVHLLDPAPSQVLSRLLSGKASLVKEVPRTEIHRVVRIGDALYAATLKGLYSQGPTGWGKIASPWGVKDIARYQGRLTLGTSHGLYAKEGRSWKKVALSPVTRLLEVKDGLHVATPSGLFKLGQEGWDLEGKSITALAEWDGSIYAGTEFNAGPQEGLYLVKPRPRRLLPHEVYSLTAIGKRLFAGTAEGLYSFEGKTRSRDRRAPQALHVAEIGGSLYAGGFDGVYRKGEKDWRLLPWWENKAKGEHAEASPVNHLHENFDGTVYLSTYDGLAAFWPSEGMAKLAQQDLSLIHI